MMFCFKILFLGKKGNEFVDGCLGDGCVGARCIGWGCESGTCVGDSCQGGVCIGEGCKAGDCVGINCVAGDCYGYGCKAGVCWDPLSKSGVNKRCQDGIARRLDINNAPFLKISSYFPNGTLFNPSICKNVSEIDLQNDRVSGIGTTDINQIFKNINCELCSKQNRCRIFQPVQNQNGNWIWK